MDFLIIAVSGYRYWCKFKKIGKCEVTISLARTLLKQAPDVFYEKRSS